jgi:hypothetical protein
LILWSDINNFKNEGDSSSSFQSDEFYFINILLVVNMKQKFLTKKRTW